MGSFGLPAVFSCDSMIALVIYPNNVSKKYTECLASTHRQGTLLWKLGQAVATKRLTKTYSGCLYKTTAISVYNLSRWCQKCPMTTDTLFFFKIFSFSYTTMNRNRFKRWAIESTVWAFCVHSANEGLTVLKSAGHTVGIKRSYSGQWIPVYECII